MNIEAILFANAAMVNEHQLLVVDGGGWRYVERGFPMTLSGAVCGVIAAEFEDFGSMHELAVRVFDDDGQVEGTSGSIIIDAREQSEAMTTPRLPFVVPFITVVRGPTLLKASVTSNGSELGTLSVIVRRTTAPAED